MEAKQEEGRERMSQSKRMIEEERGGGRVRERERRRQSRR